VAVSPVNPRPFKTLFHELAHVLLGHTATAAQADAETMPRSLEEAEAECVALLCCEALGLPGAEECRGYIQHWYGQGHPIPERSAQRVLRVADQILRAGQESNSGAKDTQGAVEMSGGRP
jgi:antirestriction protein ArdC